jgi:hypothetical protein
MLRTIAIGVGALLLSIVFIACAVMLAAHFPPEQSYPLYFAVEAITGIVVGTFVGVLQRKRAGLLAAASVVPVIYLETRHSDLFSCGCFRAVIVLLGNALLPALAFIVAHRLSGTRKGPLVPASSI